MQTANRDARDRNVESNPLFQDGDLIWDGVIIREIPEFWMARNGSDVNASTHLAGVGASSVDVGANFLCGAQSLGFVDKQPVKPIKADVTDYDFFDGVGVMMAHGIKKLSWNNGSGTRKDHGMMTIYCSAAADA